MNSTYHSVSSSVDLPQSVLQVGQLFVGLIRRLNTMLISTRWPGEKQRSHSIPRLTSFFVAEFCMTNSPLSIISDAWPTLLKLTLRIETRAYLCP
jgi:hypothetical protein